MNCAIEEFTDETASKYPQNLIGIKAKVANTICTNDDRLHHLMDDIADAFAKIEVTDNRVGKIVMPKEDYEFITKNLSAHNQLQFLQPGDTYLWGAKVEFAKDRDFRNTSRFANERINQTIRPGFQVYSEPLSDVPQPPHGFNVCLTEPVTSSYENYAELIRNKIKSNLTIVIKSRSRHLIGFPPNEWTAIDTLREMITEAEFRKYIKNGFLLVRGASGYVYQLFRSQPHTKVWHNGKVIEEICVRISDSSVPLTDNIIAFKVMIETDEQLFKQLGNVYPMRRAA